MWRIIILYLIIFYTHDFQAQTGVKGVKYPLQNNTFLYEQQNGKINYFTLDGLPAFNQSFDKLSSFDENGYAWANAGSEIFIINVIKKELIHFPNELRFLMGNATVSLVAEVSNKVYFPLKRGLYLDQKGKLIAVSTEIVKINHKYTIQNEFQKYLAETNIETLDEQRKNEIRIIREHLKVKGEYILEPGFYSDIQYIDNVDNVETYYLVEKDEKLGVLCSTGDLIIPCIYSNIIKDSRPNKKGNQHLFTVVNEEIGIIGGDGNIIIPCIYENIYFKYYYTKAYVNAFAVRLNRKYGILSNDGTFMVPIKYDRASVVFPYNERYSETFPTYEYDESISKVDKITLNCNFYPFPLYGIGENKDKTWDFYSPQGDYLNTVKVDVLRDFSDYGYFTFKLDEKFGLIGKSACLKIPPTKEDITFIQRRGELLILCNEKLENGGYKIEVLDEDLKLYFPTNTDVTYYFKNIMIVNESGNYGVADINSSSRTELSWILPPEYETIDHLIEKEYRIKQNGKTGVVDITKGFIIPIEYESIYSLGGYNYMVQENGKYSFYSRDGVKISEPIFDSIKYQYLSGKNLKLFTVLINDKWYIFDVNTKKTLNQFQFDKVEERDGAIMMTNDGLLGVINTDLIEILPIKYKSIDYDYNKREYVCVLKSGKKVRYDYDFKRKK